MSKSSDDLFHIDCGERLLTILEEALRKGGKLLPLTTVQVTSEPSTTSSDIASQPKPHWYDDPFAVIERGRYLIQHPPVVIPHFTVTAVATQALALAARNGNPISEEIRRIMDADRRESESA
jgi:hypothetical protein